MSPSTFPMANMVIVFIAGTAHAARWKYCEFASIASCPHFNPAAKNHVKVKITHQIDDAIPKKYRIINSIVHGSCFVPCVIVDTICNLGRSTGD
uniref:Putative secreted protein n=1 Tax=Panstrongylus lignarius TaxID=156445 RepID=A0A224Y226_9HEMI